MIVDLVVRAAATPSPSPSPSASGCGSDPLSIAVCIPSTVGNAIGGAVNGAASTVNFWSDPAGNTFKMLRDAASGLATQLLPQLTAAANPDLSLDWFLNAYKVSFALAVFVMALLLIPQFVRTARGLQSGRQLAESLGQYTPAFFIGAMAGPWAGTVLVDLSKAVTDSIATWGITGAVDSTTANLNNMLNEQDPLAFAGGAPVAALLMFLILLALVLVVVILVIQLITLYFVGVMVPLGLVWIIDPQKRKFGMRLAGLWVGILAAHPLLFLLLGLAFGMFAANINFLGNDASLQKTAQMIAATVAIFMAALSPLILMKFAPVIPTGSGGTNGAGVNAGSWGPDNMSDAIDRFGKPQSDMRSTDGGGSSTSAVEDAAASESGSGGLATAARAGGGASEAAGATAGVGEAAGAAAGAGGAAEGAAAMGAAGAAESATGVGAAIGIPTLIAAGAMVAGGAALSATEAAADQATGAMDEVERSDS